MGRVASVKLGYLEREKPKKKKEIHEGQNSFGKEVADKIIRYVQENDALINRSLTKHLSTLEWRPPENQIVRINFDTAFSQRHFRSTFEACACSQAVRLGIGMGVDEVEIEGDAHISRRANQTTPVIATESLKREDEICLERVVPPYVVVSLGSGRQQEQEPN
ncbi:hypothetical protein Goshw_012875 [Gossypium schwendimanii]|uniref:RNase H type-1 domain-containing protein n=1 Tax=Gossypium schwendimanii TaxID=34291 RepID=A0A7J9LFN1_GOSSC|nr:hypothetical protein [Gossypium schwendimanii]